MPKFSSSAFLDGGLSYLKANAVKMVLLKAYAAGDSAATISGNTVAVAAMTSSDYTISSSGNNRVLTAAAKTTTAATQGTAAGNDLHVAHLDSSGAAIYVTDETTDQVITNGNTVDIPTHTYTANQPT